MTNTINEYSSGIFLPNYITTDYNNDLEIALLLKKQKEYDTNLQKLNSLQATALNIAMINKKGRAKLDQYNSELNEMLSQDMGDLTDPTVQAKAAGYFTKVASDADLKQRSKLSQVYINQNNFIETERQRAMKDPSKSGYSQINEYVYRNFEGGENSFINADDVTDWGQKMELYTPYRNLDAKLVNAVKLLHAETNSQTVPDNKGRLVTVTQEGVTKERIMKLYPTLLDQADMDQINVLSKYQILTQDKGSLYESYNNWVSGNIQSNQKRIDRLNGELQEYSDDKIPQDLPAEEKAMKQELFKARREQAQGELDELTRSNTRLNAELKKSPDEFNSMGQRDLVPFISQQMYEQKIGRVADALSYMSTVQGITADQAWLTNRQIQSRESIEEHKRRMESMKAAAEEEPIFSDPTVQTLDQQKAGLAYQEMIDDNIRLKGVTTNIFEGVSEEQMKESLKDPNFRNQHKDNHYYQLWDRYSTGNQKPTVEGFNAYLKSIEEGNYIQDASVQGTYEQLLRDKQVFNYQSKKVDELLTKAEAVAGDPLDVSLSDGTTLKDYEKNGKFAIPKYPKNTPGIGAAKVDAEGRVTFPLEKRGEKETYEGGYNYYTWEEIKQMYYDSGVTGRNAPLGGGQFPLKNDWYLWQLIEKGIKQSERVYGKMIEMYDQERQAYAQYEQRTLDLSIGKNKTYAAVNVIPYINTYYSVSVGGKGSDRTEVNLTADDIKSINIPTSGKNATFVLSDSGKKRLQGKTLVSPSGQTIVISPEMAGANEFRFEYQSGSYDFMYNQMFKEEKYLRDVHKGHSIEFYGYQTDPNSIKVVVTDPTGKRIEQQIPYTGDINAIRADVKLRVDTILLSGQPVK